MNIVFFGTPEIAAYCLQKIINSEHKVSAVVTATDKPAGRGYKLLPSDVKKTALENNIPVLQPEKLKNSNFLNELRGYNADLFVVVAFRMLPQEVWQMPKKGTVNLHASLLPDYRGAAPINWAIINGEIQSGVTTFFINEQIDTGKIIKQQKIKINIDDNAGILHDKIMVQGADLLLETINLIKKNEHESIEQQSILNNREPKSAPKIFKQDCKINWDKNSEIVYNFIRGMTPFPGAWSVLNFPDKNIIVKIPSAKILNIKHNLIPGSIETTKDGIKVAAKTGFIQIENIIPEGKKSMTAAEFVRGHRLDNCFFDKN